MEEEKKRIELLITKGTKSKLHHEERASYIMSESDHLHINDDTALQSAHHQILDELTLDPRVTSL